MTESLWSDQRFREFLTILGGGMFAPPIDDAERDAFLLQARRRLGSEVRRRLLAETGAVVDPHGVALAALDLLGECAYDRRRTWLLATSDPWRFLIDLVTRELVTAYGEVVRCDSDETALAGILAASTRREVGPGGNP